MRYTSQKWDTKQNYSFIYFENKFCSFQIFNFSNTHGTNYHHMIIPSYKDSLMVRESKYNVNENTESYYPKETLGIPRLFILEICSVLQQHLSCEQENLCRGTKLFLQPDLLKWEMIKYEISVRSISCGCSGSYSKMQATNIKYAEHAGIQL